MVTASKPCAVVSANATRWISRYVRSFFRSRSPGGVILAMLLKLAPATSWHGIPLARGSGDRAARPPLSGRSTTLTGDGWREPVDRRKAGFCEQHGESVD